MYFCPELLRKRGHPFFLMWIASTQEGRALKKYLSSRKIRGVHVHSVVRDILRIVVTNFPSRVPRPFSEGIENFSLYLSAKLMYGCCVVLRKQTLVLFDDMQHAFKDINGSVFTFEEGICRKNPARNKIKQDERFQLTFSDDIDMSLLDETSSQLLEDDGPLEFPHSVPEANVTMQEEAYPMKPSEDMGFGDEGTDYLLNEFLREDVNTETRISLGLEDQPSCQMVSLNEQLMTSPPDQQMDPVPTATSPPSLRWDSTGATVNPVPTKSPSDAQRRPPGHILGDSIPLECLTVQRIHAEPVVDVQDTNDTKPSVSAQMMASAFSDSVPPELSEALLGQSELVPEQPSNLFHDLGHPIDNLLTDAHPVAPLCELENDQIAVAQEQERDLLELTDVIPQLPRVTRNTHLIIDNPTTIPMQTIRQNINSQGVSTLRKESIYNEAMSRFIRAKWLNLTGMNKPGRGGSLNNDLQRLFTRHLVTRHSPDLEFSCLGAVQMQRPMVLPDGHNDQEIHLPGPEVEAVALNIPSPPRAVQDEVVDAPVPFIPPSPKRARLDITQGNGKRKKSREIVDNEEMSRPKQKMKKSVEPQAASHQDEDQDACVSVGVNAQMPVDPIAAFHTQNTTMGQDQAEVSEMPTHLEVSEIPSHLEVGEMPPHLEVAEMPPHLEVAPPQFEAIVENLADEASQCRSPIINENVLLKISEICQERSVNILTMEDLCPPATTKRLTAAATFSAVLDLQKKKKLKLRQDRNDDGVGPIFIIMKEGGQSM